MNRIFGCRGIFLLALLLVASFAHAQADDERPNILFFFADVWGRYAVMVFGFSLLASLATGLIAYRRFWRGLKSKRPRGRGPRPWWGAYHRLSATWSLPFLLLVALTSVYYFVAATDIIPKGDPKPAPAAAREEALPVDFSGATLDQIVAAAQKAAPGLQASVALLPGGPNRGVLVAQPDVETFLAAVLDKVLVAANPSSLKGLKAKK